MKTVYKTDNSALHEMGQRHLNPVSDHTEVKLWFYYKIRVNKSDESTQLDPSFSSHVVYQYTC